MASPKKLSHLVLQTNRREQMVDWYCTILGAEVLFQNKHIAFISYDDEHHRVAFIDPGPLADKKPAEGKRRIVLFHDNNLLRYCLVILPAYSQIISAIGEVFKINAKYILRS